MRQPVYQRQGKKTRQHMCRQQHAPCAGFMQSCQLSTQADLERKHHRDRPHGVIAHPRVFHDLQGALCLDKAAQAIGHIGQAVFVKTACEPQGSGHAQHRRQRVHQHGRRLHHGGGAPQRTRRNKRQRSAAAHQPSHGGHVRHGRAHAGGRIIGPACPGCRQGQAGEKLHGKQQTAHKRERRKLELGHGKTPVRQDGRRGTCRMHPMCGAYVVSAASFGYDGTVANLCELLVYSS